MACISLPTAGLISGGASALGGIGSALIGSNAASEAAGVQSQAGMQAAMLEMSMYDQAAGYLRPYREFGKQSMNMLENKMPDLTKDFKPTMAQLAKTPGYQFTLQQGEQATQNSYAAQGLGQSGAALKGAAGYAEGLASTTYQQQFQNYLAQNQQIYSMLAGNTGMGLNAAAMTGQMGLAAQGQANQLMTGAAAAQAGGIVGSANALSSGIGAIGSGIGSAAMFGSLANMKGMFGRS